MTDTSNPAPATPVDRARASLSEKERELLRSLVREAIASLVLEQTREDPGHSAESVYKAAKEFREAETSRTQAVVAVVDAHKSLIIAMAEEGTP